MKKLRDPWWGFIKEELRRYPSGKAMAESEAAIDAAIQATERMDGGSNRLKIIQKVFFNGRNRRLSLRGAAATIPCNYETAKRWQQQFIREVAKNFRCDGLLKK